MGAPKTNRLDAAMRGLTIGVVKGVEERRRRIERDGLRERDEQIRIPISGRAEEFASWSTVEVEFETNWVDATGQRDSPFVTPHFTYGSYLTKGPDVVVVANVVGWNVNDRNETVGATIRVGALGTDTPQEFRGELHATFSGFGQPFLQGVDDDA